MNEPSDRNGHDDSLVWDSLQTAQAFRISRRHLLALNKSGRIPAPTRLGSRTVWNRRELQAFLDEGSPSDARTWQEQYRERMRNQGGGQ